MQNVKVFIERENITRKINANSISSLLKKLKINPEVVLISKNNELVTVKSRLEENDEIKLLSVISGG